MKLHKEHLEKIGFFFFFYGLTALFFGWYLFGLKRIPLMDPLVLATVATGCSLPLIMFTIVKADDGEGPLLWFLKVVLFVLLFFLANTVTLYGALFGVDFALPDWTTHRQTEAARLLLPFVLTTTNAVVHRLLVRFFA